MDNRAPADSLIIPDIVETVSFKVDTEKSEENMSAKGPMVGIRDIAIVVAVESLEISF